ncbi:MAG: hypothetical protein K6G43_05160 [Lachnospiraceae bacterium]|nr:hypothetical protein [Lachnospiraceae bacterium]
MKSLTDNKKIQTAIFCLAAAVIFVLVCLAVHDTATATGCGYYLFLQTGAFSRNVWDIAADAGMMAAILVLVLLPAALFRVKADDFAVFFLSGCALLQYVRPDRLITAFTGELEATGEEAVYYLLSYMPVWVITAAVLYLLYSFPGTEEKRSDKACVFAGISMLFMFASILIPSFHEIFIFASGYCILLPMLPQIKGRKPEIRLVIGAVMFLGSLWRLYFVMAGYHM